MKNKKLLTLALSILTIGSLVGCGGNGSTNQHSEILPPTQEAAATKDEKLADTILKRVLLNENKQTVTSSFKVVSAVVYGETSYPITWTAYGDSAKVEEVKAKDGKTRIKVTLTEPGSGESKMHLTASITVNGATRSKSFEFTVPERENVTQYDTLAAALATCDGADAKADAVRFGLKNEVVVVEKASSGVVVADESAEFYIYDTNIAKNVEVGNKLSITAISAYRYYGLPEGVTPTYDIVDDNTTNTVNTKTTTTTIKDLVNKLNAYADGFAQPSGEFVKKYKANAKVVKTSTDKILLVDPTDDTKFLLGYDGFDGVMKELASVAGLTLDVEFSVYGLWRNYTGYDCGKVGDVEFGKPENGTRFYFTGKAPSFNFASLTAEQKELVVKASINNSISIDSTYSEDKEITLPSLDATKFPGATLTWSLAKGADASVFAIADGKLTIKPVKAPKSTKLVATIVVGEQTITVEYTLKASKVKITKVETEPVVGKSYAFGVVNTNLGSDVLFMTNELSGDYLNTNTDPAEAAVVTVEAVDGGYNLALTKGEVKSYVNIEEYVDKKNKTKTKYVLSETASTVFAWNAELKTLTTTIGTTEYYMGTYNKYNTFSSSKTSYASTSFVGSFYTVE
jgi:hypothetical protein